MITQKNLEQYKGISIIRGSDFLYVSPHILLQPYIPCYTITFPTNMPNEYTILPTASTTIVISVSDENITGGLCGVDTKSRIVGNYANKMKLLLLIEFYPGCLYPFIKSNQHELINNSYPLNDFDNTLEQRIQTELIKSESIDTLINSLNGILLEQLISNSTGKTVMAMINKIITQKGNISTKDLSSSFYYSEKHIRRLFLQYVGTSPKMFSRIVRFNQAVNLLRKTPSQLTDIAIQSGFFDQPHFIHDFKEISGLTPQEYIQNMSVFYNDEYKM